jgi:hypothetical protein
LVVFDDPRFYIQILFWLDGTTQIHQHEFSGAFHVLEGSSLHAEFAFANVRPVTAHFRLGDLQLTGTELLETGRTVPITSGAGSIHSLFHLETPSVTVVVRTHSDPGTGPQFTYLPPHVAVDPFFSDALTTRRLQLLDVLDRTGAEDYGEVVRGMVAALDYERGFFTLQNCLGALRERGEWEETWNVFAKKHGALAAYAAPTLEEIVWRDRLVHLRCLNGIGRGAFMVTTAIGAAISSRACCMAMVFASSATAMDRACGQSRSLFARLRPMTQLALLLLLSPYGRRR